jgi:hypothetical protein
MAARIKSGFVAWYREPLTTTVGLAFVVLGLLNGKGTRTTSPRWNAIQFPPIVIDGVFLIIPDALQRSLGYE